MISGIYKITSLVNSKIYIGSAVNFKSRKSSHFNCLKNFSHPNKYLQASYDKYGKENFKFEIISECPKEYLIKMEQWFIDKLKPEYNICKTAGNKLGVKHSNETKLKISNSNKGRIISQESRDKISETLTGRKNKAHSLETKAKISNKNKGRSYNSREDLLKRTLLSLKVTCKKVDHIDKFKNIIQTFNSLADAGRVMNIDYRRISMCVTGKRKSYKGMFFKYSENE